MATACDSPVFCIRLSTSFWVESIQQLAVEQKRQDVADYQAFKEGQGQVLVLAEAKTLSHPFVEGLVPGNSPGNRANGFGFFSHTHSLASSSLRSPARQWHMMFFG